MNNIKFVPSELVRVHSVLLDIIKEFKRVCDKYNLKYIANIINQVKQFYMDACKDFVGEGELFGMTSFRTHNEKLI